MHHSTKRATRVLSAPRPVRGHAPAHVCTHECQSCTDLCEHHCRVNLPPGHVRPKREDLIDHDPRLVEGRHVLTHLKLV